MPVELFETRLGAEARIELTSWNGTPAIRKLRIPKSYRNQELDKILRTRRTKEEVELLHGAKLARVDCPEVYFADPMKSEIIMEYVRGDLLVAMRDEDGKEQRRKKRETLTRLGIFASRLHANGIIHGDLTTKNVIIAQDRIVVIDFGLSFMSVRIEDKAEDMHLLKQAIKSSSSSRGSANRDYEHVMKGYAKETGNKNTEVIRKQISEIERRGRYARVD
ncbi:MAG: KEOPS complex kinase/ATPase Bud32 [Nitrososphaerales archaeon]